MGEFVFIHINKTGGSSIAGALGIPQQLHITAMEVCSAIGTERWNKCLSFAFIRNPWDKVVSHYHYRVQTKQAGLADNPVGFDAWVKYTYRDNNPLYYDNPRYFMPQINWIADPEGKIIVDFIGRFERINEDFSEVCRRLGIERQLPHYRKSDHENYRKYYTEETIDIVADWFESDIELFDYRF